MFTKTVLIRQRCAIGIWSGNFGLAWGNPVCQWGWGKFWVPVKRNQAHPVENPRESQPAHAFFKPDLPTLADDNANSDQPVGCSCSPFLALGCAPWQSFTVSPRPTGDPTGPANGRSPWAKVYHHVCTLVFPAAIYRTRKDACLKQKPA